MQKLHNANMLDALKQYPDNSVTGVVTDPPYGLAQEPDIVEIMGHWARGEYINPKSKGGFMGKDWDSFVPSPEMWKEVYRVLKPGGIALVFAGSRTQDLMSISLRFAGFQIKDTIMWLYGSGFPKSHNIGKSIDKKIGKEGKILSEGKPAKKLIPGSDQDKTGSWIKDKGKMYIPQTVISSTKWNGYGSALKPAYEPIIVAVKPNDGTYANNALEHGVAGINIDDGRIKAGEEITNRVSKGGNKNKSNALGELKETIYKGDSQSRWPANVILDEEAGEMLDEQTGILKSGDLREHVNANRNSYSGSFPKVSTFDREGDEGGASRFFYCAKSNPTERNIGLDDFKPKQLSESGARTFNDRCGNCGKKFIGPPDKICSCDNPITDKTVFKQKNNHPTVKPLSLIHYLCKLLTMPENTIILDPFMGSGTTGIACALLGIDFIGCEMDIEDGHFEIAEKRIENFEDYRYIIENKPAPKKTKKQATPESGPQKIF